MVSSCRGTLKSEHLFVYVDFVKLLDMSGRMWYNGNDTLVKCGVFMEFLLSRLDMPAAQYLHYWTCEVIMETVLSRQYRRDIV